MPSRLKSFTIDALLILAIILVMLWNCRAAHAEQSFAGSVHPEVEHDLPTLIGYEKNYPIYNIKGHPGDITYTEVIGHNTYIWSDVALYHALAHVAVKDKEAGMFTCDQSVCFDVNGNVVGAAPIYPIKK